MITMTTRALRYYHESRKPHYSKMHGRLFPGGTAKKSKEYAVYRDAIETRFDQLKDKGLVDFRLEPDDHGQFEDLEGDSYDVELNKDTVPGGARTILAQQKDFRRSVERDGVFGLVVDVHGDAFDSISGFAGEYDSDYAGYATDLKASAISAVELGWESDQSGEH